LSKIICAKRQHFFNIFPLNVNHEQGEWKEIKFLNGDVYVPKILGGGGEVITTMIVGGLGEITPITPLINVTAMYKFIKMYCIYVKWIYVYRFTQQIWDYIDYKKRNIKFEGINAERI